MSNILARLKAEGSLLIYQNYTLGHAANLAGTGYEPSHLGDGSFTDNGYVLPASTSGLYGITFSYDTWMDFSTSGFTAMVLVDLDQMPVNYYSLTNGQLVFVSKRYLEWRLFYNLNTSWIYFTSDNSTVCSIYKEDVRGSKSIGITADPSDKGRMYFDGQLKKTSSSAPVIPSGTYSIGIAGEAADYSSKNGASLVPFKAFVLVNRPLTQTEMAELHQELMRQVSRRRITGIIESLKNEGVLKMFYNFTKGSTVDELGNIGTLENGAVITPDGLATYGTNDKLYVESEDFRSDEYTLVWMGEIDRYDHPTHYHELIAGYDTAAPGNAFEFYARSGATYQNKLMFVGTSTPSYTPFVNRRMAAVTYKKGEPVKFYIDGVLDKEDTVNVSRANTANRLIINNFRSSGYNTLGKCKAALYITRRLTDQEMALLYNELSALIYTGKVTYRTPELRIGDSDSDLLAKWTGRIEGNVVIDESPNGIDLTNNNISGGDDMLFTGSQFAVSSSSPPLSIWANGFTIECIYTPHTTSPAQQTILNMAVDNGGTTERITFGQVATVFTIGGYDPGYYDGVSSMGVIVGKKYHIVGTFDGSTWKLYVDGNEMSGTTKPTALGGAFNYVIGSISNTASAHPLYGKLHMLSVYQGAKSSDWVSARYNKYKENAVWTMDYNTLPEGQVVAQDFPYAPIAVQSGTVTIQTEDITINGVTKRCKVLYANTGAYISIMLDTDKVDSRNKYFSAIEYYMLHGPTNVSYFFGLHDTRNQKALTAGTNGYLLYVKPAEDKFRINKIVDGSIATASSFYTGVDLTQWHKIKIVIDDWKKANCYLDDSDSPVATLVSMLDITAQSLTAILGGGAKLILASEDGEWNLKAYRG